MLERGELAYAARCQGGSRKLALPDTNRSLSARRDPEEIIAAIAERKLSLELGPVDICFLVALHVKAESASLASFTEQQLEDVFEIASAAVQPESHQVRRRSTAAIQRLRKMNQH